MFSLQYNTIAGQADISLSSVGKSPFVRNRVPYQREKAPSHRSHHNRCTPQDGDPSPGCECGRTARHIQHDCGCCSLLCSWFGQILKLFAFVSAGLSCNSVGTSRSSEVLLVSFLLFEDLPFLLCSVFIYGCLS